MPIEILYKNNFIYFFVSKALLWQTSLPKRNSNWEWMYSEL